MPSRCRRGVEVWLYLLLIIITVVNNYLFRRSKIIFLNIGLHMLPNEGGHKQKVRDIKGQLGWKGKDGYRAESEKESCVK